MKPFNLEEALAGKPLVCRNGKPVTQFVEFKDTDVIHPLVGVCDGMLMNWTMTGFYHTADGMQPSEWDLFMAFEKKSIWINIYDNDSCMWSSYGYDSKEGADEANKVVINICDSVYIKTIEITNEP